MALTALPIGICLVVIFFWGPLEKYHNGLPSGLLNVFSILVGVGVTLLSIYYTSGEWYSVFKKFNDLGIRDGVPTRMGRDLDQNRKWMQELGKAKREVLLSGATLGGWFETAWRDFRDDLPEILKNITRFDIFLLDPRSEESKMRAKDEMYGGEKEEDSATARATSALTKLKYLMSSDELKEYWKKERIRLYLYRGTPLSVMRIDENMYFVSYLPCVS
ncbi:hypothetical protein MUP77_11045, partial [Candidatus Bathyarchaeota archaeon]|nr:hypothetical protein [Candidatus Bathyarchaeota archaeon]